MKSRFCVVFMMALFSVSLVSCAGKQAEKKTDKKEQAKDTTKELTVELGGSIDQLLRNGKLQYNTQDGPTYSLVDKTLNGISFDQAGVNEYDEDCDTIKNIHYASLVPTRSMNELYTNIYLYLKNIYGDPTKEHKSISVDYVAQYTNAIWEFDDKIIFLHSTSPRYEENGCIIVVFMVPSDSKNFEELMN